MCFKHGLLTEFFIQYFTIFMQLKDFFEWHLIHFTQNCEGYAVWNGHDAPGNRKMGVFHAKCESSYHKLA